jgi:hypothetical protein
MDLNDYWQENKRFVMAVGGGLVLFAIGEMMIGSFVGDELVARRAEVARKQRSLREARYGSSERSTARQENQALLEAVGTLEEHVTYPTRPEFQIEPARGSATNQYFARVQEVRERLLREAGRQGMRLDGNLGLPTPAPTREEEIERHLQALDLVERVCDLALEAGVERVEDIQISLDTGFLSGRASGPFEKTRVKIELRGPSTPIVRLLEATQDPARGAPLVVDQLDMAPQTNKPEEAEAEVTFAIVRLRPTEEL